MLHSSHRKSIQEVKEVKSQQGFLLGPFERITDIIGKYLEGKGW